MMQSGKNACKCNVYKTIYQREYCPIEQRTSNTDGKHSV